MMTDSEKKRFTPVQLPNDLTVENMIREQEGSQFDATEDIIDRMRRDVRQREKIRKKNHDITVA